MKLSKQKRPTQARMNMTPMIDIVFLLIIFFMTVSQVSEVNRERLDLPKQRGAEDQRATNLTVNVNQFGHWWVSGRPLSEAELSRLVVKELAGVDKDPNRLVIVIRADQRAASESVNRLVHRLSEFRVTRVRIAVEVPQ